MTRKLETPLPSQLENLMLAYKVSDLSGLAVKMKRPDATIRTWRKRGAIPAQVLQDAASDTGVSVDWLMTHEAQKATNDLSRYVKRENTFLPDNLAVKYPTISPTPAHHVSEPSPSEYLPVPHYDVRVSAGKGESVIVERVEGEFAFRRDFMQRAFGRAGEGFAIVEVRGDSMQPSLINGDLIVVDLQARRVDVSGIYVIQLRGDLLVKRIQRKLDRSLVIKCDNAAYEAEHLNGEAAEEINILGRMVWPRVR
jgi:phage repressor protein C with HTH and peptisase S24 domain